MTKKDYYKILKISKSANNREIKKAYKKLAMKYHPDRNPGNKSAENKFKTIKEAYEILINPEKRSAYDQYGHSAFDQGYSNHSAYNNFNNSADFSDIFGDVFGDIFGNKKQNKKKRGYDLQYNIELNLEEAVKGVNKKISIPSLQKCNSCNGNGSYMGEKIKSCSACNGTGQMHIQQGFFSIQQTCSYCQGKGEIIDNPCLHCKGDGRIKKEKKILVKIPPGVDNNDKIKLNNEGESGIHGGPSGDLYIRIFIKKHDIFQRKENNLYCNVPINFCLAALGGVIEVPSLNGKIKIKIPPETQSGKIFRIKGKGVHSIRSRTIGDLLCTVMIETPVNLNNQQKKILIELNNSLNKNNMIDNNPKSKRFFDGVKKFFDDLTN